MKRCANCQKEYDRSMVDLKSIMRRRDFEVKLGFEVSVGAWENICNSCQEDFMWLASTACGKAIAKWLNEEGDNGAERIID